MLKEISGDLLNCDFKYICHQCNQLTTDSAGLARYLFNKYPYADIYKLREGIERNKLPLDGQELGEIIICGNGNDKRFVINMISQKYPGRTKEAYNGIDGPEDRLDYFKSCLNKIKRIDNLHSIAFPYKIGCKLGGGDWNSYRKLIEQFAEEVYLDADVYIIKKEDEF